MTPLIMKRLLTSICGLLLVASIIFTSNNLGIDQHAHNEMGQEFDITLRAAALILNVVFLLIFLMSTLALIKKEDERGNASLL